MLGNLTRRDLLKGFAAAGVGTTILKPEVLLAQEQTCSNFVDPSKMSHATPVLSLNGTMLNGEIVYTQATGPAAVAAEHKIDVKFWRTPLYGATATVLTRHLLTIDVGANPAAGTFHPMSSSPFTEINTLTDIYVFNKATGGLLYWKQLSAGDEEPATMIVLNEADVTAQRTLTVVTRCSLHGYWSAEITLTNPLQYATAVPIANDGLIFSGTSLRRPYSPADAATSGGQGLGDLHRTRFNILNNNQVSVRLGDTDTSHPHEPGHYIMGAALYDQNGNLLAPMEIIRFSQNITTVGFDRLNLSGRGVKTLRCVMLDCLQGLVMTVFDLP